MKTTVQKVLNLENSIKRYQDLASRGFKKDDKILYATKRTLKIIEPIISEINIKVEDFRIDHCQTDEKGTILRDENNAYKWTKEGTKAFNTAVSEYFKTEIELPELYKIKPVMMLNDEGKEVPDEDINEAFELMIDGKSDNI